MFWLGHGAASSEIKRLFARLLTFIKADQTSHGAADNTLQKYFEQLSNSKTFMNAVVEEHLLSTLLVRKVIGFANRHVNSGANKCCLTLLHDETTNMHRTSIKISTGKFSLDGTWESKNMRKRKDSKQQSSLIRENTGQTS